MKNKPIRHKDSNTFKFQPFSERINSIDVDIFHKVQHEYIVQEEENETFFHQTLAKWEVLNLSESYERFQKEIRPLQYITLPQLLLNKDHIIQILLKHIKDADPLSLQTLLELVVAVARDLQKKFHNYFPEILEILIKLLNTKNTELLEWIFTCLAYLFKILWRLLVKDINAVFTALLPLLSDNKPEYINNFAAESFAFVARKVNDKKTFLNLLLRAVKSHPDGISGCGKLLFQVVYGIEGQFHSYAETMLPFLLESLSQEGQSQNTLFEILDVVISNIVSHVQAQKGDLLWSTYLTTLKDLLAKSDKSNAVLTNINLILKLLGHTVEYKEGKFLQTPTPVVEILMEILSTCNHSEDTVFLVCQNSILLLSSKNVKLSQEQASIITRKLLNISHKHVFLYFVDNIKKYASFEALILPSFLGFCVRNKLNSESFHLLTKIIVNKRTPCINGINLSNWKEYTLDFKDANMVIIEILKEKLNCDNLDILQNLDDFYCLLICLPHLVSKGNDDVLQRLEEKLKYFAKLLTEEENFSTIKKILFLINISLECLIHLEKNPERIYKIWQENIFGVLLPLIDKPEYISSLQTCSLMISFLKNQQESYLSMDLLIKLNHVIEKNFNSPMHEVRLLTAHIYTAFEHLPDFKLKHSDDPEVRSETWKVFSLIYNTESIDSHVHTYRDQIQNLEKLSFGKPQMSMCNQTPFKTIPLRYFCGALYMNFQLIWEPVIKLIASHANGIDINTFWNIFGEELKSVPKSVLSPEMYENETVETSCRVLGDFFQEVHMLKSKPDFANYRVLLWKALSFFANVAEAKTRHVSELLLTFVSTEYTIAGSDTLPTLSIKQNLQKDDNLNENEGDVEHTKKNKTSNRSSKILIKTLIQKLNVFSQIRSPLSMYREPELYKLYFDLLQHKDLSVQKAALDCIFTYKHKFMMPYKENLYNMIDDKNFKHEITTFSIDKDRSAILPEHRTGLIPMIMQIVFGKMNIKTGLRTGGKSSGQMRRSQVFRFLAGCQGNELLSFLQKALRLYNKFLQDSPSDIVDTVYKNSSLEKFLPPKKLLSTLNLLIVIHEQCGGLMDNEILAYLLKILFIIGSSLKFAFDHISEVHAGYLSVLRNLRVTCIKIIEKFFDHFDRYPWTSQEINAVFSVFVWPYLDKLNIEGIHSPTALLKLIVQWGSNPRYFPLLIKHKADDMGMYVLPHVLNLLVNDKCHISVINVIEEMLEKLLSLQTDEEDLKNPIIVDNILAIDKEILDKGLVIDKLNFGSMILLPHVPLILTKIQKKLLSKTKNLNLKELFILSRISELVWDPILSDKILDLLLPVVLKKCKGPLPEEITLRYISTILNLIKNVEHPHIHLKQISPLFAEIFYPSARKILCHILDLMSNKYLDQNLKTAAYLIGELNAFDKKWIDQPDFERRHVAFKHIQECLLEDKMDVPLGILVIYNCCFFINREHDLSARENSSHTLKNVSAYLTKKYVKENDLILNETIFNLIRTGLKNAKDEIRNEYISVLGHLARESPGAHFILRDLNKYTNKADLEVDFFENLTHLQIHRHARALLKFCQITREQTEAPNPRTLTQFILPLASHYLCREKFSNKNSIIDAAIECIGVVCRVLSWHQYERILKFYLMRLGSKLEYQKQLVRLVVTILDAFHFDLKHAYVDNIINMGKDQKHSEDTESKQEKETNNEIEDKTNDEATAKDEHMENGIEEDPEIDDFVEGEGDGDEEEEIISEEKIKIIEKISVLCKSTASRVVKTLQSVLIPKLHKSLAEMTQHDASHKVNRRKLGHEREEEDLLRVPISLAVVKLLQKLPVKILEHNLPGVFMKICSFLKSQLESVRRVARETLQKIMLTLGPKYLGSLLSEMSPLLGRGFHVHVLVYTLHGVLNCLKETYQPYDLDKILITVLNFCITDIFGVLSEEKEVAKIAVKVAEARHSKSYDTFQILAQFITEKCLLDLILPIKKLLETSHSFKTSHKAQESLRYIALGLVDNKYVSAESLLKFAYGTSSNSIPQLMPKEKKIKTEKELEVQRREREDCFIIPKVPGSRDMYRLKNVKTSTNTNAHLLVEFGLRLCLLMLKREKVRDETYRSFVDPFVVVFKKCLISKHVKLSTLTLQCLVWILKLDLPSLRLHIKSITKEIFGILHKYASAGLSKGDNFDLVVAAFKAMSVLVREVEYHTIDTNQLKILLLYVEQDIHNHERQASAFNLLKAILSRKINAPELSDVMEKIAELSITSELDHVRIQSRVVFHQYLMEYPLGNTLEKHLGFFISQLSYELRFGRESAIEMIATFINSFPLEVLKSHGGTLLVTLGARLINDEEPECRKKIADCLSAMLKKLPKPDRDPLFDVIVTWLKDKNANHRRLATQICGLFVTVEKGAFETRLPLLIPLLLKQFGIDDSPGKLVRINKESLTEEQQRIKDHHLFQVLQLLLKLCVHCRSILKQKDLLENLAAHVQSLLAYPHDWVRLGASQFLGYVLTSLDVDHLTTLIISGESDESGYLCSDPVNAVRSLTLDLCDQLQPKNIKTDLAEQVIKNLVFIAKVLQGVPAADNKPNLLWLTKRMRKIINTEIVENASSTTLRTEVFKWIAGVCTALELENILPIIYHLIGPLAREMSTTEEKNAPLRHLAKEVSNLLKAKVGVEVYTSALSKQQQNLSIKRAERKRSRTQLAVTDPENFAKRKIKRHEKKKVAKKRKIESLKGTKRNFKKRKVVDLDSSEVI